MNAIRLVIEASPADAAAGAYARMRAFDGGGAILGAALDVTFSVAPEDTALLRWAALEYAAWPYGGFAERARLASERAVAVGSGLYDAVLSPVTSVTPSRVVIETTLAPALRLPWELLHDGERFIALAVPPCAIVRSPPVASPELSAPGGLQPSGGDPLRIVLVTARPNGTTPVDSRLIAQNLYRRLEGRIGDGAIAVDYLRPPTFEALVARLGAEPAVDVVHFDGHGTAGVTAHSAGAPALLFEDASRNVVFVQADDYARALAKGGVTASILTACETATVTAGRVESAAAAIVDAGIGAVVAMGDEILIDSAAEYADAFYDALSRGNALGAAHAAARAVLARRAVFNADWWTPQFYTRATAAAERDVADPIEVRNAPDAAAPGPNVATADCVGRARELLAIDRALTTGRHVVLRGFAGAGKTTLAREAARWLTLTRAFKDVRTLECVANPTATLAALDAVASAKASAAPAVGARPLIIVDGFDVLDDAVAPADASTLGAVFERLARTAALLVTTRDMRERPPAFTQAVPWDFITVGALGASDALELARRCSSADGIAPDTVDRGAVEATIASVGGLPLGIVSQSLRDLPQGDAAFAAWAPLVNTSLARLTQDDRTIVTALRELVRGGNFFSARTLANLERERFASFVDELRRVGLGDSTALTKLPEGALWCLKLHPALMPLERMRSGFDRDVALRFARAYDDLSASLAVGSTSDLSLLSRLYAFERPNLERAAAEYDALAMASEAAALRTSLAALAGQFGGHLDDFAIGPQTFDGAEETLNAARESLAAAEAAPSPDPLAVANARVIVGIALDRAGNTSDAVEETQRACAALASLAQPPVRAQPQSQVNAGYLGALINLGGLQRKLGRDDDARATLTIAKPLADASDRTAAVTVHMMLGDLALDATEANKEYGLTVQLAQLLSAPAEEAGALFGLAGVAQKAGYFEQAERLTRDAVSKCASIGDVRRVASGYLTLGSLAVQRGTPAEAERWFATLRGSPGYAACDGRTRAFFDAAVATDLGQIVLSSLGRDGAVKTATTLPAWQAAVRSYLASDAEMQRRLASTKELAERVVAEHGDDAGCAAVEIARNELKRIALMEGAPTTG